MDLDRAFAEDENMDELGVMMTTEPPYIFVVDHKLGVSVSVLKPLFIYSLNKLKEVLLHPDHEKFVDDLISLTRSLLIVKGDLPQAFNIRKRLIRQGNLNVVSELLFLKMLFTKHPKSPSSWEHRRWCLSIKYDQTPLDLMTPEDIDKEQQLCTWMADIYPKNYYAWVHRLWLLQFMDAPRLYDELEFTFKWLHSHVSDHSAASHRQHVVERLLTVNLAHSDSLHIADKTHSLALLMKLMQESTELIRSRPGNETMWYHRRGMTRAFMTLFVQIIVAFNSIDNIGGINTSNLEIEHNSEVRFEDTVRIGAFLLGTDDKCDSDSGSDSDSTVSIHAFVHSRSASEIEKQPHGLVEVLIAELKRCFQSIDSPTKQFCDHAAATLTSQSHIPGAETGPQEWRRVTSVLLQWLRMWLVAEAGFCRLCATDTYAWSFDKQRQMALRYFAMTLYMVSCCISECVQAD